MASNFIEETNRLASIPMVPLHWPSAWTDPALLKLIGGSPFNCLLLEDRAEGPVAEAARRAGLTVSPSNALKAAPLAEVQWDSPAPQITITGLVWPRIKLSRTAGVSAEAGPTGAPWIDSNCWVGRLARVRVPGKPVWLDFQNGQEDPLLESVNQIVLDVPNGRGKGIYWWEPGNIGARGFFDEKREVLPVFSVFERFTRPLHRTDGQ